jgi:PAS domain-containing protein
MDRVRAARPHAAALGLVALAIVGAWALQPIAESAPFALFLCAVVLAVRLWGTGPGLLATVASVAVLDYYYLMPTQTFALASANAAVDLTAFAFASSLVSTLATRLGQARSASERASRAAARSAASLDAVLEAADDGVVVFGADGRIHHANGWFRAWWLVHYGAAPTTTEELNRVLGGAAPETAAVGGLLPIHLALRGLGATELLTLRTSAGVRRVRLRATPILGGGGRVRGAVAVWHDITDAADAPTWSYLTQPTAGTSRN